MIGMRALLRQESHSPDRGGRWCLPMRSQAP